MIITKINQQLLILANVSKQPYRSYLTLARSSYDTAAC